MKAHTGKRQTKPNGLKITFKANLGSDEIRHTSAAAGLSEMKIAIAQPPCQGGRARCFESWMTKYVHQTRNSATESIPASLLPNFPSLTLGAVASVGSNTETDDD